MKLRRFICWVLFWGGLTCCLLAVSIWFYSKDRRVLIGHDRHSILLIQQGRIAFLFPPYPHSKPAAKTYSIKEFPPAGFTWRNMTEYPASSPIAALYLFDDLEGLVVSLWMLAILAGGVAVLGRRLRGSSLREGYCVACGYNLTGVKSDKCPECGTPFARREPGVAALDTPDPQPQSGGSQ